MKTDFEDLAAEIRSCRLCEEVLPLGPRPVFQASPEARILIVGQAPGIRVHQSGKPFDDPSGDRLRNWLGISREKFYDSSLLAIIPMGFCYPGTGSSGDLPPRLECAKAWRTKLLAHLPRIELTVLLGTYALQYHLGEKVKTVTSVVKRWEEFWPGKLPMPHPSPRNNRWLKQNAWFEAEVIPVLQEKTQEILQKKG